NGQGCLYAPRGSAKGEAEANGVELELGCLAGGVVAADKSFVDLDQDRRRDVGGGGDGAPGSEEQGGKNQGVATHHHGEALRHDANVLQGVLQVAARILDGQDVRDLG